MMAGAPLRRLLPGSRQTGRYPRGGSNRSAAEYGPCLRAPFYYSCQWWKMYDRLSSAQPTLAAAFSNISNAPTFFRG